MKHLKYLQYVVKHKWYTFLECCKLGIPWLGIIHDWSKFLPGEWSAYADTFYGGDFPTDEQADEQEKQAMRIAQCSHRPKSQGDIKRAFDLAWLHHQKCNKHHWQYWLLQYDIGDDWKFAPGHSGAHGYVPLRYQGKYVGTVLPDYRRLGLDYIPGHPYYIDELLNRSPVALPMPDKYRREMLADWRGAGKAITGEDNTHEWYIENKDRILLHPDTREWLEGELATQ